MSPKAAEGHREDLGPYHFRCWQRARRLDGVRVVEQVAAQEGDQDFGRLLVPIHERLVVAAWPAYHLTTRSSVAA